MNTNVLSVLRQCLEIGVEQGSMSFNPGLRVERAKEKPKSLTLVAFAPSPLFGHGRQSLVLSPNERAFMINQPSPRTMTRAGFLTGNCGGLIQTIPLRSGSPVEVDCCLLASGNQRRTIPFAPALLLGKGVRTCWRHAETREVDFVRCFRQGVDY